MARTAQPELFSIWNIRARREHGLPLAQENQLQDHARIVLRVTFAENDLVGLICLMLLCVELRAISVSVGPR